MKIHLGSTKRPVYLESSRPTLSLSTEYRFEELENPWYEAPWFDDTVSPSYSSFTDLRSAISEANSGDTLDFAGARFELKNAEIGNDANIFAGERVDISGKDLTIKNLTIDGSRELTWSETSPGSGIYETTIDLTNYLTKTQTLFLRLIDRLTRNAPLMATTPSAPTYNPSLTYSRFALNDNWHTVVGVGQSTINGAVFTDDNPLNPITGPNNQTLYGFRITNEAMRASVLSVLQSFSDVRDCIVYYFASGSSVAAACVESYTDDGTNLDVVFKDMPTLKYPGYFKFSLSSPRSDLVAGSGEYCVEPFSGKLVYAPEYQSAPAARLPRAEVLFRVSGANVNFENCNFIGASVTGGTQGAISCQSQLVDPQTNERKVVSLEKCSFGLCSVGCTFSVFNINNCSFEDMTFRGLAPYDGSTITNSRFSKHESASAILVQSAVDTKVASYIDVVAKTTVSGCFFDLASSVHGQAVSLYFEAWLNGEIHGNIFYNCEKTMSFRERSAAEGPPLTDEHSLIIANNLFVQTYQSSTPNQWAIAWNGSIDDTYVTPGQEVYIVNNSMVGLVPSEDLVNQKQSMETGKLINSSVYVANNIAHTIASCLDTGDNFGHYHAANGQYGSPTISNLGSFGANDYRCSRPNTTWASNLTPQSTLLISDDSAGANPINFSTLGVVWERLPSIADMTNLRIDWAAVANPTAFASLPYSTSWSEVYRGQDLR